MKIPMQRKSFRLAEIVAQFGGDLIGNPDALITQVATLESATDTDIAFLAQTKYLAQLKQTAAGAVILGADHRDASDKARIVCANPYAYFAKVSALLNPPATVEPGIHETAVVAADAQIAAMASIGACAVIGAGVSIGDRSIIGAGCVIGDNTHIGADCLLHANVTIYYGCRLGARCIVHSGAVIGADGFGLAHEEGRWKKIPQIGGVQIGDDVEVGANTTIDRGALDDTVIGEGVKLDNQIQIAHNVVIGAHTAIAACVGIAGSAHIGSHCTLGGAAMIYGHITIADHVNVSAGTLIMKSLRKVGTYTGVYPFTSHERWLKTAAQLRQLEELADKVRQLEYALEKIKEEIR